MLRQNLHVWNADSLRHIRHIELLDSLTCGFFVAGNTHVVLGSSAGSIVIADVTSCHVTERLPNAHQGAVRAIAEHPKKTGYTLKRMPLLCSTSPSCCCCVDLLRRDRTKQSSFSSLLLLRKKATLSLPLSSSSVNFWRLTACLTRDLT